MTQLVDLIVDRRIFLYVGIGRRQIRFRLVVIVVTDEVADGILGEQFAKLVIKLRRQRFVRRHDKRRLVDPSNHIGHRKRLTGTGDAEQHLVPPIGIQSLDQFLNGLRLIALGFILCNYSELSVIAVAYHFNLCGSIRRRLLRGHLFRVLIPASASTFLFSLSGVEPIDITALVDFCENPRVDKVRRLVLSEARLPFR